MYEHKSGLFGVGAALPSHGFPMMYGSLASPAIGGGGSIFGGKNHCTEFPPPSEANHPSGELSHHAIPPLPPKNPGYTGKPVQLPLNFGMQMRMMGMNGNGPPGLGGGMGMPGGMGGGMGMAMMGGMMGSMAAQHGVGGVGGDMRAGGAGMASRMGAMGPDGRPSMEGMAALGRDQPTMAGMFRGPNPIVSRAASREEYVERGF